MANSNLVDLPVGLNSKLKRDNGSKTKEWKNNDSKDHFFDVISTLPLIVMLSHRGVCILPNRHAILKTKWREEGTKYNES
jgi:hypothetical protein